MLLRSKKCTFSYSSLAMRVVSTSPYNRSSFQLISYTLIGHHCTTYNASAVMKNRKHRRCAIKVNRSDREVNRSDVQLIVPTERRGLIRLQEVLGLVDLQDTLNDLH